MYGHESPSDEDVPVSGEKEAEDPSVNKEALVEFMSTESGNVNIVSSGSVQQPGSSLCTEMKSSPEGIQRKSIFIMGLIPLWSSGQ
ncbi:hypothetical protein NPIL_661791 [Nephila pilipes]|uniref:Uncharacterized protein n=1 Tax=Nephila pilipes TaxID=299642 RepID=A0A8X6U9D4_NEPPI|nr:hypothetical protein NPIL_661791 [Nephila pilipes]